MEYFVFVLGGFFLFLVCKVWVFYFGWYLFISVEDFGCNIRRGVWVTFRDSINKLSGYVESYVDFVNYRGEGERYFGIGRESVVGIRWRWV